MTDSDSVNFEHGSQVIDIWSFFSTLTIPSAVGLVTLYRFQNTIAKFRILFGNY